VTEIATVVQALRTASRPADLADGNTAPRLQVLRAAQVTVSNALRSMGMEAATKL
jgi:hypothetical protein